MYFINEIINPVPFPVTGTVPALVPVQMRGHGKYRTWQGSPESIIGDQEDSDRSTLAIDFSFFFSYMYFTRKRSIRILKARGASNFPGFPINKSD
jgi:hypothetical protein